MARIRPPVRLVFRGVQINGVATVNGGIQQIAGSGDMPTTPIGINGSGVVHFATAQITGSGAISLKRFRVANGAGQSAIHRGGSGSLTSRKLAVAGTGTRIIGAAAGVQLYNALGNPSGWGPSNDSLYPTVTGLAPGDVWWPSNVPAGMTLIPLPGGSVNWATSGMAPGNYYFTANIRQATTGNRSQILIPMTVSGLDMGLVKSGRHFMWQNTPIYLVGGDCWQIHADATWFNWSALLDQFADYRINKVRIAVDPHGFRTARRPYVYNSSTQKYDLETWDTTYWTTLKAFMDKALALNIVVELSMSSVYPGDNASWQNSGAKDRPTQYRTNNNINGAFSDDADGDFDPQWFQAGGPISTSGRTIRDYQTRLYDKALLEVGSYPNIFFEVHNEPYVSTNLVAAKAYLEYWAAYLKARTSRPVGVGDATPSDFYDNVNVDVLNTHTFGIDPVSISSFWHASQLKGKVLTQNESNQNYEWFTRPADWYLHPTTPWVINPAGVDTATQQMWGHLVAGSSLAITDIQNNVTGWSAIGNRMKVLHDLVDQCANFFLMSPVDGGGNEYDGLVTAGPSGVNHQVMAYPGVEYIVFFWGTPSATNVVMTLATTGNYIARFCDTRNGADLTSPQQQVTSTGGATTITSPSPTLWAGTPGMVLFLRHL